MTSQTVLRTGLWLALGGWVGSWAFFAFVVSRVAFQVLPGDVAGDLAGMLLGVLHLGGAGAAFVVVGASVALGRRGLVVGLPLLLGLVCLASELFLSPEVAAVRPSTLGAESTVQAALRFRRLHAVSLGIFLAVHAGSIALVVLHARLDAAEIRGLRPPPPAG
jgi:hypothetical protein